MTIEEPRGVRQSFSLTWKLDASIGRAEPSREGSSPASGTVLALAPPIYPVRPAPGSLQSLHRPHKTKAAAAVSVGLVTSRVSSHPAT